MPNKRRALDGVLDPQVGHFYEIDRDGDYFPKPATRRQPTERKLPEGFWSPNSSMNGLYLSRRGLETDGLVDLPNPATEKVLSLAKKFMDGDYAPLLASVGLINKAAILMHGEPGTSKTVTINRLVEYAFKRGWAVIDGSNPGLVMIAIREIRKVEPDRGLMVIWEEFDSVVEVWEDEILQLLDGQGQVPNVLYLMTTNDISEIPARIFLRYRRIQFQVLFDLPGLAERKAYFDAKVPADRGIDTGHWAEMTEGMTIDQCSQLLISCLALGQPIDEIIDDLAEREGYMGIEDGIGSKRKNVEKAAKCVDVEPQVEGVPITVKMKL
jgi:hypothetical protein